jgi:uncharacterized protein with HEPN domain
MQRDVNKFLHDILGSIVMIETYLTPFPNMSSYVADPKTVDAVERRLSIIGEAMWKADKLENTLSISNKSKIIGLRHIIIHDYDVVDTATVWMICKKYLNVLKEEIGLILESE